MPRPFTNNDESSLSNMEPQSQYSGRMPVLSSSRGGHHHQTSYHREGHRAYHLPYARPSNHGHGTEATPFFGEPSHRPYGYEYYGDNKPYAMPITNLSIHSQGPQVHQLGQSCAPGSLPPSEIPGVANRPHPANPKKEEAKKKPPRPYTEYNIFFQLERERILGELEEEQRKKQRDDAVCTMKDMDDVKLNSEEADGVTMKKGKTEMMDDVVTSPNDLDEEDDSPQYTTPSSPGIVLNRPSDCNDILPRPTRFEHLQLAPLWYDSTHRLALSKINKSRRRHRKTHGLVGFLDLTKRISKAWAEADDATKEYCKRVANRQLQIYKEELKLWKTRQDLPVDDVEGDDGEENGEQPESGTSGNNLQQHVRKQNMLRMREISSVSSGVPVNTKSAMPPPPPPPPPHPLAMPVSAPIAHNGFIQRYDEYWQQQQVLYQRQGPYLHPIHPQHRIAGHPPRPYHAPVIPRLTPNSECRGGHKDNVLAGVSDMNHTALDELMHRRKIYGSRVSAEQNPQKFRSPGTSRQERSSNKSRKNDVDKMPKQVGNNSKDGDNSAKSYLSPSEIMERTPSSTAAITPSPSRRHASSHPESDANGNVGMDKDLSATDSGNGKNAAFTPGSNLPSAMNDLSPNSTSPGNYAIYAISPSCMMTPGESTLYGGQHAYEGSYMNGGFGEGDVSSSPFPYIDWGSPHDRSPQDGRGKGHSNGLPPQETGQGANYRTLPSHLAIPGVNGISWNPNVQQRSGSHYVGHHHSPGSSRYSAMMLPPSPYPIVDGDVGDLDLDEEEMQLLWRRLATHANRKRLRERDAASAWMNNHHGYGSFSASPGGESLGGEGMSGNFAMAHSFSSPLERPEMRKSGTRSSENDGSGYESGINVSGKGDNKKATELPSLQDAI
ncbi:hypothetical protein ACHAXH_001346 [Discostella pseudostelligera]